MSEKLNLEWIDFQSNVSQSFGVFRHEDYLQDVTLVTDDNTQISAHKLILSACSEYFKGLFQTNAKHTYPLVCLNDVDGKMLGYILDYMYHGQVQILEESLDIFIKVAQRFKLDGIKVAKETGIGKADPDKKTEREGNGGQDRGGGGEYYEGERPRPPGPVTHRPADYAANLGKIHIITIFRHPQCSVHPPCCRSRPLKSEKLRLLPSHPGSETERFSVQ